MRGFALTLPALTIVWRGWRRFWVGVCDYRPVGLPFVVVGLGLLSMSVATAQEFGAVRGAE